MNPYVSLTLRVAYTPAVELSLALEIAMKLYSNNSSASRLLWIDLQHFR